MALTSALKIQSTQPRKKWRHIYSVQPCFLHAADVMDTGVSCSVLPVKEMSLLLLQGMLSAGIFTFQLSQTPSRFIQDEILSAVARTQ